MQTIRTIRCKLNIPTESLPVLNDLFDRYAKACTEIAAQGRKHREANSFKLHRIVYKDIRAKYSLSSNLAITAIRRVCGNLKTAKFKGKFLYRSKFVGLDARTFTLKLEKGVVSFSTHTGKRITAPLDIAVYQHEALWGADKAQSATLIRAKDGFYCNIVVECEVPDAAAGGVLGVDLGIRNIAALSSGRKFEGDSIKEYRKLRWKVRASLQSKGTKGAKRVLKRLSGLDARRMTSKNHWLAKQIVSEAVRTGCDRIALEDLKGIRDRVRVPNKHLNRMVSLWAFAQLQEFVKYKAAAKGIRVILVKAAYTSQTCGKCFKPGLRNRETFVCTACSVSTDADENAALVIAARGAGAGVEPADRNAARIVEFFTGESLHKSQAKAAAF